MAPPALPAVKYLVRAMKMSDARALAAQVMGLSKSREIQAACNQFHRARVAQE
jgi:phosphotransferase system enzyme I (PtsI)